MAKIAIHKEQRIGGKSTGTWNHDQLKAVSRSNHSTANILSVQQTRGNQASQQIASNCPAFGACPTGGACHSCRSWVQTKLTADQSGGRFEQEAERVSDRAKHMLHSDDNEAASGATAELEGVSFTRETCPECAEEPVGTETNLAPVPISETTVSGEQSPAGPGIGSPGLIVEDSARELAPGQMRKSEFMAQLRETVCNTAEETLSGTGGTAEDCPYIDYWLGYYKNQDSSHIEGAMRRYAPEAAGAAKASDFISLISERVRVAVEIWVNTGQVTGVPKDLPVGLPGEPSIEQTEGGGKASANVSFKALEGGAREPGNSQSILSQLGQGRPLESGVKSRMESAFGYNFSRVRVHANANGARLSSRLNARAFTIGSDIAFGPGEFHPGTLVGDALIAHELAHVVQQGGATAGPMYQGGREHDGLEEDADRSAVVAVASLWAGFKNGMTNIAQNTMPRLKAGLRLQRCGEHAEPKRRLVIIESDVTGKRYNNCGEFFWYVNWTTTGRSGFIVQAIINTYSARDCTGAADTSVAPTPHLYEAWQVDARGNVTPEFVTPHGRVNDKWSRPQRPDANGTPGSQGEWSMTGKVYWTKNLDPAASFSVGAVPDAHQLLSTTTQPTNLGSSLLDRQAGGNWDCCAGASRHDPA